MPKGQRHSLLLVDDHPIYCEGMALALAQRMRHLVIHTANDASAAEAAFEKREIDLVLCDYRLPRVDGLSFISRISESHPTVATGLLCADLSPQLVSRAIAAGAIACLSKERNIDAMVEALECLLEGRSIFDAPPIPVESHGLTAHRIEILRLAAQGLSNKLIAQRLNVTERTIKDHWSHIFARLEVSNRVSAIGTAHALGLIEFGG